MFVLSVPTLRGGMHLSKVDPCATHNICSSHVIQPEKNLYHTAQLQFLTFSLIGPKGNCNYASKQGDIFNWFAQTRISDFMGGMLVWLPCSPFFSYCTHHYMKLSHPPSVLSFLLFDLLRLFLSEPRFFPSPLLVFIPSSLSLFLICLQF